MNPLTALGRAMDAIMPWPSKRQRKAAIRRARDQKEQSQRAAVHAGTVTTDIEALAARNHFAATIASQIIERHQRGQGAT